MNYVALVGGEERQVEVEQVAPSRYQIVIDGRVLVLETARASEEVLSLLADARVLHAQFETKAGATEVQIAGQSVSVEMLDLRKLRMRKAQATTVSPDGPIPLTSPMPGKIVAVLVTEGDTVEEGQGIVVVEAMKMENELRAPKHGVVEQLTAVQGEAVEGGATLCVVR